MILPGDMESSVGGTGDWPGRAVGLSPREAEIIALITQGLSNQDVAERAFLSVNTVKTYIRSAYRKIGVANRPQAVIWGMSNGFEPDSLRTIDPALLRRKGNLNARTCHSRDPRSWLPSVSRRSRQGGSRLGGDGSGKWLIRRAGVGM